MHVVFTTDEAGADPAVRGALRHMLLCRGWFLSDEERVRGPRISIRYADPSETQDPVPGELRLSIARADGHWAEAPPPPDDAVSAGGESRPVAWPVVHGSAPAGSDGPGVVVWSGPGGAPLAIESPAERPRSGRTIRLLADVLKPAAFLLSRAEERDGLRDSLDRFVSGASWLSKHRMLETPLVDQIGALLDDLLRTLVTRAHEWTLVREPWPGARPHAIAITHDQDQSIRWERRLARHAIATFTGPDRGRNGKLLLRDLRDGAVRPTVLTERLLQWERDRGVEATWFFLTVDRDRFGRRYDVASPPFRAALDSLRRAGHSVGLHGSLRTFRDAELLASERAKIRAALGADPAGVRQHYLRADFPGTWALQREAGFSYDASLGFPDDPGFRAGTSFPLIPDELAPFVAMPLAGMDRALLARGLTTPAAWHDWATAVRDVNGLADVLWHPYFIDSDFGPDRERATLAMLDWAASADAWVVGLDAVAAWWRARCEVRIVEATDDGGERRIALRADQGVRDLALTPVGEASDIRIAGSHGIEARWDAGRLVITAEPGGTMTLSKDKR